jgi:hypothetical protein
MFWFENNMSIILKNDYCAPSTGSGVRNTRKSNDIVDGATVLYYLL